MLARYLKKKKDFKKRFVKGSKIFLNKRKTKSFSMLMNNVETEKSENMVAKDIKIFQKIKKTS